MNPDHEKAPAIARSDTDQSLRVEREKTDEELIQDRSAVEEDSDAVVGRARDRADEVLHAARDQSDRAMTGDRAPPSVQDDVARERRKEDELLAEERALEDTQLELERDERKRALQELLRLEREATDQNLRIERARSDRSLFSRDDLLAIVSHDLRDLLGAIALNTTLIVKEAEQKEPADSILRRAEGIRRVTARMNRLIGDLVDIASIEAGKLRVTPKPGDAAPLARESVEAFQPSAAAKGVTLAVEVAGDALVATFDPERVMQVLANLLSNAIKFTPAGGSIVLRLDRLPNQVRFTVRDTGPGIAADAQSAVFMRFWQADTGDRRGMGLGLYISRCLVEAQGGVIWLESEPGRGSTFCFTLPAA